MAWHVAVGYMAPLLLAKSMFSNVSTGSSSVVVLRLNPLQPQREMEMLAIGSDGSRRKRNKRTASEMLATGSDGGHKPGGEGMPWAKEYHKWSWTTEHTPSSSVFVLRLNPLQPRREMLAAGSDGGRWKRNKRNASEMLAAGSDGGRMLASGSADDIVTEGAATPLAPQAWRGRHAMGQGIPQVELDESTSRCSGRVQKRGLASQVVGT